MPSVFTIQGPDLAAPRKRGRRRKRAAGATPAVGDCKTVENPRTGCRTDVCYVGKARSRTGWKFKQGTTRCPTRR